MRQPYLLRGNITFGNRNPDTRTEADKNSSKIDFELFANIVNGADTAYGKIINSADSISKCPREILKFNPPPQSKYCDQNVYRDLTTLHDYGFNITFSNVSEKHLIELCAFSICNFLFIKQNPEWLEHELNRLDYLTTSISSQSDLYQFSNHIDALVNTHSDRLRLTAFLNGKNITLPNLPLWFNRNFDAKFDRSEQFAFSIGYARRCFSSFFNLNY